VLGNRLFYDVRMGSLVFRLKRICPHHCVHDQNAWGTRRQSKAFAVGVDLTHIGSREIPLDPFHLEDGDDRVAVTSKRGVVNAPVVDNQG